MLFSSENKASFPKNFFKKTREGKTCSNPKICKSFLRKQGFSSNPIYKGFGKYHHDVFQNSLNPNPFTLHHEWPETNASGGRQPSVNDGGGQKPHHRSRQSPPTSVVVGWQFGGQKNMVRVTARVDVRSGWGEGGERERSDEANGW